MRLILCAVAAALAGCATTERVWEGGGNFDMDQGQCQAQAFGTPFASNMQVALVYNSCMRGKGWQLVERPLRR
jgi:hypothetical protein